jgi:diguanylate cyclase (GGDEF)-like protein
MRGSLLTQPCDAHGLVLAKELDVTFDPWLSALLPHGQRIIVMALADGEHQQAWVVFEHGARRGSRVARRLLSTAGQATTTAKLALSRAELLIQARQAAATDGLTGVFNRASLDSYLAEWQAQGPDGTPLALTLVDVDHFKAVNDTYGHQAGDAALRHLADLLQSQNRDSEIVARYGGEEFVVIFPRADALQAAHRAEAIRQSVRSSPVPWGEGEIRLTASFGVAAAPEHGRRAADLVAAADAALYTAKSSGRDRVVIAPTPDLPPATLGVSAPDTAPAATPQHGAFTDKVEPGPFPWTFTA